MKTRVLVFAVALAVGLALPTPTRARAGAWRPPIWSSILRGGPWGLATDARGAVVVSDAGFVRAIDRRGVQLWETKVDGATRSNPAISGELVLVGATGRVVALARRNGASRWQQPMNGQVRSVALAKRHALAGGTDGTLRAFDASTGAPTWAVRYPGLLASAAHVDLAASVVVASWHEPPAPAVRALDLGTGVLRWEQPVGLYTASPALYDGRAFIAQGDGRFRAMVAGYDLQTGASDWALFVPASFQSGVLLGVDDRDLVVADQLGLVTAIDPVSGNARWTRALERSIFDTRVVLLRRRVVLTTLNGELFVLDRVSGRVVARGDANDFDGLPRDTAPFRTGNRVLVSLRLTEPGRVELRRVP
jgi:outer membrane protein assembly factor BamB